MPRIFICYRRADSQAISGRIYDRLVAEFDKDNVFKDVNTIQAGSDWRGAVREAVSTCEVILVIIGPNWLKIKDKQGKRRLDDPNDTLRFEVETGLAREGAVVIPVLVHGASIPKADELPLDLRELAFKQSVVIHDDPDFHTSVDRLIEKTKEQIKIITKGRQVHQSFWTSKRISFVIAAIIIPLMAALLQTWPNILTLVNAQPPTSISVGLVPSPTQTPLYVSSITPTHTITPTASESPTSTSTPTPTYTSTNTPSIGNAPINLVLFVESDSLTLFIPGELGVVSLEEIGFQVDTGDETITKFIDENYSAIRGLPFEAIEGPMCLRLELDENDAPLPEDCPSDTTYFHSLSSADIFWYDTITRQFLTITVVQGSRTVEICSVPTGQSGCRINFERDVTS